MILETQSTLDQMSTTSLTKTLVKSQPIEEELLQNTFMNQESLDKELTLSQLVQAQRELLHR